MKNLYKLSWIQCTLVVICHCFSLVAFADTSETICHVHKVPMKKDTVPAIYGLIVFDPEEYSEGYFEAQRRFFPNSNRIYFGGCVIDENAKFTKEVLYCPKCREVEGKWGHEHPVIKAAETAPNLLNKISSRKINKYKKQKH